VVRSNVIVLSLVLGSLTVAACTAAGDGASDEGGARDAAGVPEDGGARGDVNTADAPVAPAITKLAFVASADGPRILVAGTDPNDRLESVWIDLLDEDGQTAAIDPDGDGVTEPSQLEISKSTMEKTGTGFFFELQSSPGLERFAARVTARTQERDGAMGEPRSAVVSPLAVRASGEACDLQGFDVCSSSLACVDTPGGSGVCTEVGAARGERCSSAPVVAIGATTNGIARGASLWDPPDGCASAARQGRPEGVVRLHVSAPIPSLTIATMAGGTTFDSVVTVLDGCGSAPKELACNDDDPPPSSRVTLTNVTPGDYVVVIDSLDRAGGTFELAVTAP
jgi:hypothetical protein